MIPRSIFLIGPSTGRRWIDLKYETVFILTPELPAAEIDETIKEAEDLITKEGGTVVKTERWEKKRLAYTVKKHKYGYYVLIRFDAPPSLISSLERYFKLKEHIIKYLTVKIIDTKKKTDSVSLSSIKDKAIPKEISEE